MYADLTSGVHSMFLTVSFRCENSDDEQPRRTLSQSTPRKKKLDNILETGAATDILEVYDACNAGAMKTGRLEEPDRRQEILVSCGVSSQSLADEPCSFTDLFGKCLGRHPTGIDTALLHLAINNRILGSLSGLPGASRGRWYSDRQSPIRFVLSGGKHEFHLFASTKPIAIDNLGQGVCGIHLRRLG